MFPILHFGWNESRLGPITHPSLAKHGIFFNHLSNSYLSTYDRIQKVHSTEDYSVLPTFPSIPHKAFASFLYESILSFNDMIKRFDSKLILGLQPIINTNRSYSNRLHQYLCSQESFYNTEYQDSLYMVLPDMIMQNSELSFVNIDDKIYQLEEQNSGNDDFIFIDSCHLNSRGDAFVAEIYSEFISSSILS